MTDAIFVINFQGDIEVCNQGSQSLVGYEQDEMVGQPLQTFLTKEDCTIWMQELVSDEEVTPLQNLETSLQTAYDERIPVLASASPIRDEEGGLHGAVFVLRDLRERKKLEEQVYRSSEWNP